MSPRLEWRYVKSGRLAWWWADHGPLGLCVHLDYSWEVNGIDGGASRSGGPEPSLAAAQVAAEAAALRLLVEAVAAFNVEAPEGTHVTARRRCVVVSGDETGVVSGVVVAPLTHARALGCALLTAAVRAGEGRS